MTSNEVTFGSHNVTSETVEDGVILRHAETLELDGKTLLDSLDYWAEHKANVVFMRERTAAGWIGLSYKEFSVRVRNAALHLGTLDISSEKPLLIVAPNSINHAVVTYAAMSLGVPVTPVSVAYAQVGETFERLNGIIQTIEPGAIYFSDTLFFKRAVLAIKEQHDIPCITSHSHLDDVPEVGTLPCISDEELMEARKNITQATVAKILMTSGSTGVPKGVINTHLMMYSNQVALAKMWPFLSELTPNLVDWLPWSHTFGGNCVFNIVLFHGGTLTIDDGKPTPSLIGRTLENTYLIEPNIHFNVPAGIEMLLAYFEDNHMVARNFFGVVKAIFVAGAALPDKTRNRFKELAIELTGQAPKMLAGWGATETAPFATCVNFDAEQAINIGVPLPGTDIKLKPTQDKLALLVRGPNITPGYWRDPAATDEVFDEKGFYNTGDTGRLCNPDNPSDGLAYDGRVSENFKLRSGTWVNVNKVRIALVSMIKPLCTDAVITGHNESDVGALLVPNIAYLTERYNLSEEQRTAQYLQTMDDFIQELESKVNAYNEKNVSNSTRIHHATLLPEMPSIERNEVTDKGNLNQRALLENHAELITSLHAAFAGNSDIKYYKF